MTVDLNPTMLVTTLTVTSINMHMKRQRIKNRGRIENKT